MEVSMKYSKILIFSGAGLSAESGIATFRKSGTESVWDNFNLNEVCNQLTWKQNANKVHNFYNLRRKELETVEPNNAHYKIAEIKEKYGSNTYVITQNVDDLLERAGCSGIIHVHGELTKMECTHCNHFWEIGYNEFNYLEESCPKCKSKQSIKPYVVLFNGKAPKYADMHSKLSEILEDEKALLVVIGTMGNVIPIGLFLKYRKCKTILNNLEPSEYLPDVLFDEVYYEPCTTFIDKLILQL